MSQVIADARRTLVSVRLFASCALFTVLLFWVIPAMFPERPRWAYAAVVILGGISLPWGFAERMKTLSDEMAKKIEETEPQVVTGDVTIPEPPIKVEEDVEMGEEPEQDDEQDDDPDHIRVPDDLSGLEFAPPAVADPHDLGTIPGFMPEFRSEEEPDVQPDDE